MLGLMLIAILVTLVLVSLFRSARMPDAVWHGAACGECGYGFSGWTTCPECGKAAAHSGVLTPALWTKFRADPSGMVLGWLILGLVAGAMLAKGIESACIAARFSYSGAESSAWIHSDDGRLFEVALAVNGLKKRDEFIGGQATITVRHDPEASERNNVYFANKVAGATHSFETGEVRVFDGDGNQIGEFDRFSPEAASLLYKAAGMPIDGGEKMASAGAFSERLLDEAYDWEVVPAGQPSRASHRARAGPSLPFAIFGTYGAYYSEACLLAGIGGACVGIRRSLRIRARAFAFARATRTA